MVLSVANLTPEQVKLALKEGIREWLDEKFAQFGKWSFVSIAAAGLGVLTYFVLVLNGWHPK